MASEAFDTKSSVGCATFEAVGGVEDAIESGDTICWASAAVDAAGAWLLCCSSFPSDPIIGAGELPFGHSEKALDCESIKVPAASRACWVCASSLDLRRTLGENVEVEAIGL